MMEDTAPTLLYLAHLNWDHVWQRPQQLMTRFAERCSVIYVDPPQVIDTDADPRFEEQRGVAGVRVLRPIFPERLIRKARERTALRAAGQDVDGPTEGNIYQQLWLDLLPTLMTEAGLNPMLWVSSPLADYLVKEALPYVRLAIYDCMDDLASFRGGTDEMRQRETHLLSLAELVFTGGRSMYEARKDRHPHVHCFPSAVDIAHFQQALDPKVKVPAAVQRIPQPRLGYFGVLDERIDWEMIAEVARRRPEWQWVLVGPRAKVKRSEIAVGPSIHYLGKQPYRRLPAFLKGFDIATMPFALNEATRNISPTKTPEYLSGGKPVISTSIADVIATYGNIVTIADGADGWIEAITTMLEATPKQHEAMLERAAPILQRSSWDSTVERMWDLIQERIQAREVPLALAAHELA